MNFREIALNATSLSELMNGRTKLDTKDIVTQFPEGITITGVDLVEYEKDGKNIVYPVIIFKENENAFYMGGLILKKIVEAWAKQTNGDYKELSRLLVESGGVKIKLSEGKSKTGNNITNVEVL